MGEQIIMLGTGSAMATKCYNTCFCLMCNDEYFLVDAGGGNGILKQIEDANISWRKLHNMFVTHSHTDHIIGAVWIIRKIASLMSESKYTGEFYIYCHDEAVKAINSICSLTLAPKFLRYVGKRIMVISVGDGDKIFTKNFDFVFFDIHSDKTKQFGLWARLYSGKTLVCLGDEPYNEKCKKYVENTDYLMCEAFCLYSQKEIFKPYEKYHSTVLDAARLAKSLNVKNLVLYHTEDKTLATRKQTYTAEAESVFDGNIYVPDDLEVIDIK